MDMHLAQDLAKELGIAESELWRAWNVCQTPEARLRRLRRQLADIPDGAREYVPVSVWGANPQKEMAYIVGDVTIEHGYVCVDGVKVEVASNLARNEFGYSHAYTWEEVARMGVPIWADEEGAIWCEDPDRYMAKWIRGKQ